MFWNKPRNNPSTRDALTEEAVVHATRVFATGGLRGSDTTGWRDGDTAETSTIEFHSHRGMSRINLLGCLFKLTTEQADRVSDVIARRVLDSLQK